MYPHVGKEGDDTQAYTPTENTKPRVVEGGALTFKFVFDVGRVRRVVDGGEKISDANISEFQAELGRR